MLKVAFNADTTSSFLAMRRVARTLPHLSISCKLLIGIIVLVRPPLTLVHHEIGGAITEASEESTRRRGWQSSFRCEEAEAAVSQRYDSRDNTQVLSD
jgi:hypothetical protein